MSESLLRVVLDACVIFRSTLRDTLLRAAEEGLYEVRWSDSILDEASRNLVESGFISLEQAERLLRAMRQAFSEATVRGFEYLIPHMTNDEKDRHVLAAAVEARADLIVTSNLKDFPDRALVHFNIEAKSPDQFLMILFRNYPEMMIRIVMEQAAFLRNPPKTITEVLDDLALHAPQFVALVLICDRESQIDLVTGGAIPDAIAEFHELFDGFRGVGGLAHESPETGFFTKILRLSIADAPKNQVSKRRSG